MMLISFFFPFFFSSLALQTQPGKEKHKVDNEFFCFCGRRAFRTIARDKKSLAAPPSQLSSIGWNNVQGGNWKEHNKKKEFGENHPRSAFFKMSSQKPKRLTGGKRSKTEQKRVDRKKGNKNPLLNQTTTRQKKIVGHGMLPNKALPGHNTHTHTTHSQTHPANKRTPGFKKSSSNYVSTPHVQSKERVRKQEISCASSTLHTPAPSLFSFSTYPGL